MSTTSTDYPPPHTLLEAQPVGDTGRSEGGKLETQESFPRFPASLQGGLWLAASTGDSSCGHSCL